MAELSKAGFAYLFSEMVVYAQRRVRGVQDLEKRYGRPSDSGAEREGGGRKEETEKRRAE